MANFLVIVSPTRPDLYSYIRRAFFTDARLQIIFDRRQVVRRRTRKEAVTLERRVADRRVHAEMDERIRVQGSAVVPVGEFHPAG